MTRRRQKHLVEPKLFVTLIVTLVCVWVMVSRLHATPPIVGPSVTKGTRLRTVRSCGAAWIVSRNRNSRQYTRSRQGHMCLTRVNRLKAMVIGVLTIPRSGYMLEPQRGALNCRAGDISRSQN